MRHTSFTMASIGETQSGVNHVGLYIHRKSVEATVVDNGVRVILSSKCGPTNRELVEFLELSTEGCRNPREDRGGAPSGIGSRLDTGGSCDSYPGRPSEPSSRSDGFTNLSISAASYMIRGGVATFFTVMVLDLPAK